MKTELQQILLKWPKRVIREVDLAPLLPGSDDARHSVIKRAMQEHVLVRLARGVYFIEDPFSKADFNHFEVAQALRAPSYVSFESALSYHQLIPEAVYGTTCTTTLRSQKFHTEKGNFYFRHLPVKNFFLGVERVEDGGSVFFIATPWRALADHYFVFKRPWVSLESVFEDLRIEELDLADFSTEPLRVLAKAYPSPRVRRLLAKFLSDLER